MTDADVMNLFLSLYADLRPEDAFDKKKPLLAHYTTIQVLEKILASNEVWFSNPLFMNDMEEVRFGINQGNMLVMTSHLIESAWQSQQRAHTFKEAFSHYYNQFANQHVLDTYVFCLSDHARDDDDGLLSMWRGYGANGNGVAIVFDTAQIVPRDEAPLIIAKVEYATTDARLRWLQELLNNFTKIVSGSTIPDEKIYVAAYSLFERIKLFSLFTKHHGFKEEAEWRVVYMPERDIEKKLGSMFQYSIGSRGVEPKLRFKIAPVDGFTAPDLSLEKITDRIILGPSTSSPLAAAAVQRMLELLNHSGLKTKLRSSTIPFRAIV